MANWNFAWHLSLKKWNFRVSKFDSIEFLKSLFWNNKKRILFIVNGQKGSQKAKKEDEKKGEEFTCPEGQGNGNFADPATCRRFYQVN